MWSVILAATFFTAQPPAGRPVPYDLLQAEHERADNPQLLLRALSEDTLRQRLAVRALGRFEAPRHAGAVQPLLTSPAAGVRREAANALAQMRSVDALPARFDVELDPMVRGTLYESWGRVIAASPAAEQRLRNMLNDSSVHAQRGAARASESYLRRTARSARPSDTLVESLRTLFRRQGDAEVRLVTLLALTAAGERDGELVDLALRDSSAQVRRAAVTMGRRFVDDPHPMVRWQALRTAPTCERAAAQVRDPSEHVMLLAVDVLGELRCDAAMLVALMAHESWRVRAHATASLSRVAPDRAMEAVRALASSSEWQARAWAAQSARRVGDTLTLDRLAADANPNVTAAALRTPAQARRALASDHAGLLLEAATRLKDDPQLADARAALQATFARISTAHGVTWRDPRIALLERIGDVATGADDAWLTPWLADADPAVAAKAAAVLGRLRGTSVAPVTTRYVPAPLAPPSAFEELTNATAVLRIRGKGEIVMTLLTDEAPLAVHTFATLARSGAYAGRTMHRIVPNFVIQGGSPGGDEYDPATDHFMRDEVGARNARGTFGISTRGRDTGDGQLYVNLVDNIRLDHDYTVFARTVRGLDVVDAVQEGDVIESVTILPAGRR
jgi:cyclophilin family peptidyl-prolyl cis-trans isomerase